MTVIQSRQVDRPRAAPDAPKPLLPPATGPAALVSSGLTMLALVSLWMVAQVLYLGGLSHDRDQSLRYSQLRTELAAMTAPTGPIVELGQPVALLSIPAIGVSEVVIEGTASGDLLSGPGHRRDTPLPGQEGVSVVYGRATSYGAPFRAIGSLRRGDQITVVSAQGELKFLVLGIRRAGTPLPQPAPAGAARLTLVSAEGEGAWSGLRPSEVVYVDAQAEKGFPVPAGRPLAIPDSEQPMASDGTATPLLAFYLGLLIALTVAVAMARQRWSAAVVWVLATPIAMALAWVTTDTAMRLLPNLL